MQDPILYVRKSEADELDAALSREVLRIERVLEGGDGSAALRQMKPLLTHLRRIRAAVRRQSRLSVGHNEKDCLPISDAFTEISRLAMNIARLSAREAKHRGQL